MGSSTKEKTPLADPLNGKTLAEMQESRFNTLMRVESAKLIFIHGSNAQKENFENSASRLYRFIMGISQDSPKGEDGSPLPIFEGK